MKYKISALKDGNPVYFVYDNIDNTVYDEAQNVVNPTQYLPKGYTSNVTWIKPFNPADSYTLDLSKVRTLVIAVGTKCNFHCPFCHQRQGSLVSDLTKSNLENIVNFVKTSGLDLKKVFFWGGEPLVYWKSLKILIEKLRKLLPKANFYFPTNGSLLTKDIVDFCAENVCDFSISHDGLNNQTFRDKDVLKDSHLAEIVDYAFSKKEIYVSLAPVLSNYTSNVLSLVADYKKKFPNHRFTSTHNILGCHSKTKPAVLKTCEIEDSKLKEINETLYKRLMTPYDKLTPDYGIRNNVILGFIRKANINEIHGECGSAISTQLTIDADLNVYPCADCPDHRLGNLKENKPIQLNVYHSPLTRQKCRDCYLIHACRGKCPLMSLDGSDFEVSCRNNQAIYNAIFRSAFNMLFGVYITKIEKL